MATFRKIAWVIVQFQGAFFDWNSFFSYSKKLNEWHIKNKDYFSPTFFSEKKIEYMGVGEEKIQVCMCYDELRTKGGKSVGKFFNDEFGE